MKIEDLQFNGPEILYGDEYHYQVLADGKQVGAIVGITEEGEVLYKGFSHLDGDVRTEASTNLEEVKAALAEVL